MTEPLTPTLVGMWNDSHRDELSWAQFLLVVSQDPERFGDAVAKHASALLWHELA